MYNNSINSEKFIKEADNVFIKINNDVRKVYNFGKKIQFCIDHLNKLKNELNFNENEEINLENISERQKNVVDELNSESNKENPYEKISYKLQGIKPCSEISFYCEILKEIYRSNDTVYVYNLWKKFINYLYNQWVNKKDLKLYFINNDRLQLKKTHNYCSDIYKHIEALCRASYINLKINDYESNEENNLTEDEDEYDYDEDGENLNNKNDDFYYPKDRVVKILYN